MTRPSAVIPASSHSRGSLGRDPSVAIAVLGGVLAVREWLSGAPLWLDEAMVALNLRDRAFLELPGALWLAQSAPLGWLATQRAVLLSFGEGERALRFVPLLFGLGTLAAAVWIGRRWLGRWSAPLLVFLCVFGQWLMYYRLEAKHYSADTFWALLLPAFAAWALEGHTAQRVRRWVAWWCVAALGQWFANGAALVTPGCAIVMLVAILSREGRRDAVRFALAGVIWVVAFGAHFELALKYSHHSPDLRSYWASELPAASLGMGARFAWLAQRLAPLAQHPGGAALASTLWVCAASGFAFASRRWLGALFATVPLSAFAFAAVRIVPLHGRVSLWIAPALYVGAALAFDRGIAEVIRGRQLAGRARRVGGAALVLLSITVAADVAKRGWRRLSHLPTSTSNLGTDERSATRWLMERRRPTDAILTTRAGWPGIWWYGGIRLGSFPVDSRLPNGTTMYRVDETPECSPPLDEVLAKYSRVLVYVGLPDLPREFSDRLMNDLSAIGTVTETDRFADLSRVAVVELHAVRQRAAPQLRRGVNAHECITATPVTLW